VRLLHRACLPRRLPRVAFCLRSSSSTVRSTVSLSLLRAGGVELLTGPNDAAPCGTPMTPVKLQLPGGELRRARLAEPTYDALLVAAQGSRLPAAAALEFVDDEGDVCRLTSDAEVQEAVLLAGTGPLRVIVSIDVGTAERAEAAHSDDDDDDDHDDDEPPDAATSLSRSMNSMRANSQARLAELLAEVVDTDSDSEEPGLAAAMVDVLESPRVLGGTATDGSDVLSLQPVPTDPELLRAFEEFDAPQFLEEAPEPELESEPQPQSQPQPMPEAVTELGPEPEPEPPPEPQPPPAVSPRPEPAISPPAVLTHGSGASAPVSVSAKRRQVEQMLEEAHAEVTALKQLNAGDQPAADTVPALAPEVTPAPDAAAAEAQPGVSMFIPFDNAAGGGAKKTPRRRQSARKSTGASGGQARGGRARAGSGGRGRSKASGKKTAGAKPKQAARGRASAAGARRSSPTAALAEGVPQDVGAAVGSRDDQEDVEADDVAAEAAAGRRGLSPRRAKAMSPPAQSPTKPASSTPRRKKPATGGAASAVPVRQQGGSPPPASSAKKKTKGKAARNIDAIAARREERRAAAAAIKLRADTELAEHGGDRNDLEYRRAVRGFRAAAARGEVQIPTYHGSTTARLQVFVRMRPLSGAEDFDVLTRLGRHALVAHRPHTDTQYIFDGIFTGNDSSALVSKKAVQQQLDSMLQEVIRTSTAEDRARLARKKSAAAAAVAAGRKGSPTKATRHTAVDMPRLTVFAYGQTGSGKTYTMEAITETVISSLLQFATDAPELMASSSAGSGGGGGGSGSGGGERRGEVGAVYISMTSFEIFADKCYDLLADGSGLPPLVKAYEDASGELRLPNLTESLLVDESAAAKMLRRGRSQRRKGANAVHDNSSRSHAITQLEVRDVVSGAALSRFTLVDLAGSERASETMSDDAATRQEGAEINKSLLALKECIRALDSSAAHTPFRQSKLTQVLRDSLETLHADGGGAGGSGGEDGGGGGGGSGSRAVMIATVAPVEGCLDHTLNTLRYADRLKELSSQAAVDDGGGGGPGA
jgi:hypothetical protein